MDSIKRIGLVGSAGLGKSSTAMKISERLNISFLESKAITRPILKKYGYVDSKSMRVEDFLSKKEIEFEIVDRRTNEEYMAVNGFVTDRTTLECFAYALLSNEGYADDEIGMLERVCRDNMLKYTDLFYFPYGNGWLEENGVRTVNKSFQRMMDMIIRCLLDEWQVKYNIVGKNAFDDIMKYLGGQNG